MTKEEFLNLETQRKESGLSIPNFSAKCNINKYTYYHYKRKYIGKPKTESKNDFIKIELPAKKSTERSNKLELEMRTSFGTEIRLKGSKKSTNV